MNWKLIFLLSLFGLAMAVLTVSVIPMAVEPFCWLAIFIICAVIIAKNVPGNFFWHGFAVSMVNCVWIIVAHVFAYRTYMANHPQMKDMAEMPVVDHHRINMVIMGIVAGIASGLVLGLFSWVASRSGLRKKAAIA